MGKKYLTVAETDINGGKYSFAYSLKPDAINFIFFYKLTLISLNFFPRDTSSGLVVASRYTFLSVDIDDGIMVLLLTVV